MGIREANLGLSPGGHAANAAYGAFAMQWNLSYISRRTLERVVNASIREALAACRDEKWRRWAKAWLDGKDRTQDSAHAAYLQTKEKPMSSSEQYVVTVPGQVEHFEQLRPFRTRIENSDIQDMCHRAIRKAGLTTPRRDPGDVVVTVARLEIENGALVRRAPFKVSVRPPLSPMTETECEEDLKELVKELPEEFQAYVREVSYEQGHYAGNEEIVTLARDMVCALRPYVLAYEKRIAKT